MAQSEQLIAEESKTDFKKILSSLLKNEDIQGVATISRDGIIQSDFLPDIVDKEKFATIMATLVGSSSIVISQLKNGNIEKLIINYEDGKLFVFLLDDSLLTAIVGKDANANRIIKEIEEIIKNIKEVNYGRK